MFNTPQQKQIYEKQEHVTPVKMPRRKSCRTRRSAFTLVELMVVIAIAAVVSGITLGGYRSVADGNQRVSCQTNLRQIYGALQLYGKDNEGFYPPYDPTNSLGGNKGIGLWALYARPSNDTIDKVAELDDPMAVRDPATGVVTPIPDHKQPFALYVKNRRQLHCPADVDNDYFYTDETTKNVIDMNYLSYQGQDGTEYTYQPWRGVTDSTVWNVERQLLRFETAPLRLKGTRPASDAVITWCRWHRNVRDVDNVLFASGVVRPVPKVQTNPNYPVPTGQPVEPQTLEGWNRKPPF